MKIKEIEEQLEKIKEVEDKLSFLEKLLKETKDEEIKEFILEFIESFKSNKQSLDDIDFSMIPLTEQEISSRNPQPRLEETPIITRGESSIESTLNQLADISNIQREEPQANYGVDNYGSSTINYDTGAVPGFESLANRENNFIYDIRDKFIREGIFTQERAISQSERDNIKSRLHTMFPGASEESIIKYETDILNSKNTSGIYQKKQI